MAKLALTYAGRVYDITRPLYEGLVNPEGIELNFVPTEPEEFIWRMVRYGEFDVSEMSLSSYTMAKTRGASLTAIPVFPYRRFRQGYIFCNTKSKVEHARDLKGRRMGVLQYQITASVWMRGFLHHEYDVQPHEIHWVTEREEPVPFQPPANLSIQTISNGKMLEAMLLEGEIDAWFTPNVPESLLKGDPRIRRLFSRLTDLEKEYFLKTKIYPIMHTVAIKEELLERHPWVAQSLYKAFQASKQYFYQRLDPEKYSFPWFAYFLEEQRSLFGHDPYPFGLAANKHVVETFLQYSQEQGLISKKPSLKELFAETAVDA